MRLLVVLLLLGCDDRTSVLVDIEGRPLSSLNLTVSLPGRSLQRSLGALTPPRNLLILLPDAAQQVDLQLYPQAQQYPDMESPVLATFRIETYVLPDRGSQPAPAEVGSGS